MATNTATSISTTTLATTAATAAAAAAVTTRDKNNFKEFIVQIENLVLNTTIKALQVTTHVYGNLTKTMSPVLLQATKPLMDEYLHMVEQILLTCPTNYTEQRKLLRYFRYNNRQIERLRQQLQPQHPKFEFHLISSDFYYNGNNVTEFDNLYSNFMKQFDGLSQMLWATMSEEVVEQQQDLLEILDEISNEKELSEKDKLYDEFIEMFLFKNDMDTMESRQLE